MNHSPSKARNSQSYLVLVRTASASLLAMIGCSAMAELIVWHVSRACLISMALALASQLAAFGEAPENRNSVQTKEPAHVTALIGRVNARTGTPVVGATISLEESGTRRRTSTISTTGGSFQFSGVPAGEYRLEISAHGYRTFVVAQLPLVAGDVANANAVLDPGNAADLVMGSSGSVTSRVGTALAGKSVSDLPENQRNFVNVVQVFDGANEGSTNASASGSRPGAQHDSSAVSIGGEPEGSNFSQIDGMDNNERINSKIAVHPSVEAVEAVQIFASAYPASMGQAGGGFINVVTTSGHDTVHGSVYEYFRNDLLDAFPYQFGAHNSKPELRQNQFGASAGGPLIQRKTFLFGDYEGFRLVQGRAPVALTVPTAYQDAHPGDFTDMGGPLLNQLDPVGLAYFGLYPLPNVQGSDDQFVSAPSGSNFSHTADLRIDQHLTERESLFGRFSYNNTQVYIPGQFPAVEKAGVRIEPGGSLSSFAGNMHDLGMNTIIEWDHQFRQSLSLALRGGYVYWHESDTSLNSRVAVNQAFGQPGINLGSTGNGLAPISVLSASPLGADGFWRPLDQGDHTIQFSGMLTSTRGAHSLVAGATMVHRQWFNIGSADSLGLWKVNDLPSLLRGQFIGVDREVDLVEPRLHTWEWSAYMQDTWKVNSSLTLDVGLRYDPAPSTVGG